MPQLFRKDSINLGANAKSWLDVLQLALTDAGWTVYDDQFTSAASPSGYRIFAPGNGLGSGNGLLEIFVDSTTTRFRCWDVWNASTHVGTRETLQNSRTHDLGNGFNYFLEVDSFYVALIIQTTSATNSPIVAGVKAPDVISDVYALQGFPIPRGYVAEPNEGNWQHTHYAVISLGAYAGASILRDWEIVAGTSWFYNEAFSRLNFSVYSNDGLENAFVNAPELFGLAVWPMQAGIGDTQFLSGNVDGIVAYLFHKALPGCKKTNSAASSPAVLLVEDNLDLYLGKAFTAFLGADLPIAEVTSCTLTGDASFLPVTGGVIRLNNEYIQYTSRSGLVLNGLSRGVYSTTAFDHKAARPSFSDDFNRADGALGANWTANDVDATYTVSLLSNRARMTSTVATGAKKYNVIASGSNVASPNVEVECDFDFNTGNAANEVGLILRWQNSSNFYYVTLNGAGTLILRRVLAGVDTSLGSIAGTTATTGTLKFSATRDKLMVFVNGVKRLVRLDSSFSSGSHGFRGSIFTANNNVFIDNFVARRFENQLPVIITKWYTKSQAAVLDAGYMKP